MIFGPVDAGYEIERLRTDHILQVGLA